MTSNDDCRILVCIPACNEAKTIANLIKKAKRYATEVIVYDDGSTDNTNEVAKAADATVFRDPRNKGYGSAIKALFQIAKEKNADIVVTMDSDGQHNPEQIPDVLMPILHEGVDIVIGSRFLTQTDRNKVPAYRGLGIKTITRLTRTASYSEITDAQSGFRAYSRNALSKIDLFQEGMAVSTEILLKAKENNLPIKEVPITVEYDVEEASTHNPVSHGLGVLFSVIQFISLRNPLLFYGLPGVVLLIVSAGFIAKALELFSTTRYVSTPLILISLGMALIGLVLLSTGAILHTLTALLRGKIKAM
jgi:glycosyltransferase involved in cell wall biosynthesis